MNGQAFGSVASTLLSNSFDIAGLRPWIGNDGRHFVAHKVGDKYQSIPTFNANATLRKDEWKQVDDAVSMAARERLRLIADLQGRGLTFNVPNGMGTTVLETQRMGDITPATISMDPARKSEGDRPEFDIVNLPLPVIHKDFFFTARQIAVSRNGGQAIDVTTAQLAARRVAEEAEKLALGVAGSYSYGGGTVYGLTNYPGRMTKVLTSPTATGWTPQIFISELLAMRQQSTDAMNFGPWMLYISPAWDAYLDDDYSDQRDITLRQRLAAINGITGIQTLDFLTGFQVLLVQMTSDVIRLVNGMNITTLQWETDGGMRVHFKVMAILVPQIRSDIEGNTGIVHGTAP